MNQIENHQMTDTKKLALILDAKEMMHWYLNNQQKMNQKQLYKQNYKLSYSEQESNVKLSKLNNNISKFVGPQHLKQQIKSKQEDEILIVKQITNHKQNLNQFKEKSDNQKSMSAIQQNRNIQQYKRDEIHDFSLLRYEQQNGSPKKLVEKKMFQKEDEEEEFDNFDMSSSFHIPLNSEINYQTPFGASRSRVFKSNKKFYSKTPDKIIDRLNKTSISSKNFERKSIKMEQSSPKYFVCDYDEQQINHIAKQLDQSQQIIFDKSLTDLRYSRLYNESPKQQSPQFKKFVQEKEFDLGYPKSKVKQAYKPEKKIRSHTIQTAPHYMRPTKSQKIREQLLQDRSQLEYENWAINHHYQQDNQDNNLNIEKQLKTQAQISQTDQQQPQNKSNKNTQNKVNQKIMQKKKAFSLEFLFQNNQKNLNLILDFVGDYKSLFLTKKSMIQIITPLRIEYLKQKIKKCKSSSDSQQINYNSLENHQESIEALTQRYILKIQTKEISASDILKQKMTKTELEAILGDPHLCNTSLILFIILNKFSMLKFDKSNNTISCDDFSYFQDTSFRTIIQDVKVSKNLDQSKINLIKLIFSPQELEQILNIRSLSRQISKGFWILHTLVVKHFYLLGIFSKIQINKKPNKKIPKQLNFELDHLQRITSRFIHKF